MPYGVPSPPSFLSPSCPSSLYLPYHHVEDNPQLTHSSHVEGVVDGVPSLLVTQADAVGSSSGVVVYMDPAFAVGQSSLKRREDTKYKIIVNKLVENIK